AIAPSPSAVPGSARRSTLLGPRERQSRYRLAGRSARSANLLNGYDLEGWWRFWSECAVSARTRFRDGRCGRLDTLSSALTGVHRRGAEVTRRFAEERPLVGHRHPHIP